MGCGGQGGGAGVRQQQAPAAMDFRVAERFALLHLNRVDQMYCMSVPAPGSVEVPCTAFEIEQDATGGKSTVRGIRLYCKRVETRSAGPACRGGEPVLPGLPGWPQATAGPVDTAGSMAPAAKAGAP